MQQTTPLDDAAASAPSVPHWRRWLDGRGALLLLTIVLFALAQLPDPQGHLSTDVGGKTATVEVILDDGWRNIDLGYWAEDLDPDGSLYPMAHTSRNGDAWVNVTTLPMLYLAAPLVALGGMRHAILIPVLGAVMAAAGARRLATMLGADAGQQRATFWLVGLASPATIYALDFWEHTLGLGLMVWGAVGVLRASRVDAPPLWVPALSGFAFAAAASMRQEALAYGFVAGAVLGITLLIARRPLTAVFRSAAMVVGTSVGFAANVGLENAVFGTDRRSERSVNTAGRFGDDLGFRIREAIESALAPMTGGTMVTYAVAFGLAACLGLLAWRADRPREERRILWYGLAAISTFVVLDLAIDGMRFIPGLLATTPVAAFGAVRGWTRRDHRVVALLAIAPLPLVWAVQYTGGVSAQWGGRYIMTTGTLLTVLAVVSCTSVQARATLCYVAAGAIAVTTIGIGWAIMRTHALADVARHIADRPEDVIVFENASLGRETGPLVLDQTWLAASSPDKRAEAADLLDTIGVEEFVFVHYDDGRTDRDFPAWEIVAEEQLDLVNDLHLRITTWTPAS